MKRWALEITESQSFALTCPLALKSAGLVGRGIERIVMPLALPRSVTFSMAIEHEVELRYLHQVNTCLRPEPSNRSSSK
jgi:hypothetical protein